MAILNIGFVKRDGKLCYIRKEDEALFRKATEDLREGQKAFAIFDMNADNGRLSQIAKLKACIKEIAKEQGVTFREAQDQVKARSGFPFDETKQEYKSFGDCSKDELSDAIQTVIEIGDFLGANFR